MDNQNSHISGIKCTVNNCVYHAKNDCCEAGQIEVCPGEGKCTCSQETCCETFKPQL